MLLKAATDEDAEQCVAGGGEGVGRGRASLVCPLMQALPKLITNAVPAYEPRRQKPFRTLPAYCTLFCLHINSSTVD